MNEFYLYAFASLLIAIYLSVKSDSSHKYITFIIAYWILAHSVLNTQYFIIDIRSLPFDLQPARIIFILFSLYLFSTCISKRNRQSANAEKPLFETCLYLYIFLSIIVDTIHTIDILSLKDLIVNSTKLLTFLVIYLVLKIRADREMLKALGTALLIVCTISSIIGIYQFLFDPLFFRLGSQRVAFSGLLRSNGIFHAEYVQSFFLIPGIILALFTIRQKLPKYALIALFILGIIFTFYRTSYIITVLLLTLYFIRVKKTNVCQMLAVLLCIGIALIYFSSILSLNLSRINRSSLFRDRLLADTMTGRIGYYTMVLKSMPKSWLIGFGSRKSNAYYKGMLNADAGKEVAMGEKGGIHNRYLAILFYRGVLSMTLYILFCVVAFYNFWKLSKFNGIFYFIPLFDLTKFILSNMTDSYALHTDMGLLLAIFLGTGVAVYQNNIDMSGLIVNE